MEGGREGEWGGGGEYINLSLCCVSLLCCAVLCRAVLCRAVLLEAYIGPQPAEERGRGVKHGEWERNAMVEKAYAN